MPEHDDTDHEEHGTRLHELGNQVAVVKLQVEHAQEMIRVRFTGLESRMDAHAAKLDSLLERTTVDPADATPAGRELLGKIEALENWRDSDAKPLLDQARGVVVAWRLLAGGSLLTALLGAVSILLALGVIPKP